MMGYFSSALTKYNSASASHFDDAVGGGTSSSSSGSVATSAIPAQEDHILTVAEAAAAMPPHSDVSQAIGKAKKPRKTNKRGRSSATDLTVDASTPVSAEIAQDTPPAQEEAPEPATGDASAGAAQPRRQLTYEEKVAIIAAYECGKTYSEIAQAFGRYVSTISRFIQHYKATRSFECKTGRGSKRKTSEKDDKALVRIVMHDRFLTSRKVMEALPTLTVSQRTVRRRIAELSRFKTIPNTSVV